MNNRDKTPTADCAATLDGYTHKVLGAIPILRVPLYLFLGLSLAFGDISA